MLPPWRLKVVVWAGTARLHRQTRPIPLCCWKTPKVRKGWSKRRRGEPVSPDGNRVRKIKETERWNGHLERTSERPNKILGKFCVSGVNLRWAKIYYESSLVSIEKSSSGKGSCKKRKRPDFAQVTLNFDLLISLAIAPTPTASLPALMFSVKTLPWY